MKQENHIVTGIVMADVHVGPSDLKRYWEELNVCLFQEIQEMDHLDFITICGDLFDAKEYLSSDVVLFVLNFIKALLDLTESSQTEIVVLEGTRTHDSLQLSVLEYIYQTLGHYERFKVVNTVEASELCGLRVLYIPEEYIVDQELYYKEYFNQTYDLIFGHGMIDKIWYGKKKSENMENHTSAPVFAVDDLCQHGNYVYFGHIHEHKIYGKNKRFRYVGPMTRWQFDMFDSGYYTIKYDKQSGACIEEYIENTMAPIYKTIPIMVDNHSLDECQKMMDTEIKENLDKVDKLRLVVWVNEENKDLQSIKNAVISRIGLYQNIKLIFNIKEKDKTEEEVQREETNFKNNEYLFKQKSSYETQIADYIKIHSGVNIPIEDIKEIIGV